MAEFGFNDRENNAVPDVSVDGLSQPVPVRGRGSPSARIGVFNRSAAQGGAEFPSTPAQPLHFNQLGVGQQGLAMVFFFLAMLFDPKNLEKSGLDKLFGGILGLNPDKGETFAGWQADARKRNETPQTLARKQDYSRFDFKAAEDLKNNAASMGDLIRKGGENLLHPDLVARMEKSPDVRKYVEHTFDAAKRNGIDGVLLANQFWQESRYNVRARSPAGAMGIAQFIPGTGAQYGLRGNDFYDPIQSIDAGARHMADLTKKFGSQELALAGYNGGAGSVNYVKKSLGKTSLSVGEWMGFMGEQRERLGKGRPGLWRHETYDYITKISPAYWSESQKSRSREAMARVGLSVGSDADSRVAQKAPESQTPVSSKDSPDSAPKTPVSPESVAASAMPDSRTAPEPTLAQKAWSFAGQTATLVAPNLTRTIGMISTAFERAATDTPAVVTIPENELGTDLANLPPVQDRQHLPAPAV